VRPGLGLGITLVADERRVGRRRSCFRGQRKIPSERFGRSRGSPRRSVWSFGSCCRTAKMSRPTGVWILYVPGPGHCLSRTHLRIARAGVRSITGGGRLIRFRLCTGRPAMARNPLGLSDFSSTPQRASPIAPDRGEPRSGLQNRWAGESSPAGSIPVRLR